MSSIGHVSMAALSQTRAPASAAASVVRSIANADGTVTTTRLNAQGRILASATTQAAASAFGNQDSAGKNQATNGLLDLFA